MVAEKRLYRLTYPDTAPKGAPRAQTGVVERRLTAEQAARFERAIARGYARVKSIEPVEEG